MPKEFSIENDYLKVTVTTWGAQIKSVIRRQIRLLEADRGTKALLEMRKHLSKYCRGGVGSAKLREKITPGTGLVFPGAKEHLTEGEFLVQWNRYVKESGITCTPHELRHSYATILWENGIDPKDAQYLLGHAQLSTTMDIYTDIREAHMQKVRASLVGADIG